MAQVRYIGDGEHYVPGLPAVEGAIEDVDEEKAASLVETGLYEMVGEVKAPKVKVEKVEKQPDADGAASAGGDA